MVNIEQPFWHREIMLFSSFKNLSRRSRVSARQTIVFALKRNCLWNDLFFSSSATYSPPPKETRECRFGSLSEWKSKQPESWKASALSRCTSPKSRRPLQSLLFPNSASSWDDSGQLTVRPLRALSSNVNSCGRCDKKDGVFSGCQSRHASKL